MKDKVVSIISGVAPERGSPSHESGATPLDMLADGAPHFHEDDRPIVTAESPLGPSQVSDASTKAPAGVSKPIKFRQLSRPKDVRRAYLKVINALLAGELEHRVAGTAIYGLHGCLKSIELDVVERRLAAIEERLGDE